MSASRRPTRYPRLGERDREVHRDRRLPNPALAGCDRENPRRAAGRLEGIATGIRLAVLRRRRRRQVAEPLPERRTLVFTEELELKADLAVVVGVEHREQALAEFVGEGIAVDRDADPDRDRVALGIDALQGPKFAERAKQQWLFDGEERRGEGLRRF